MVVLAANHLCPRLRPTNRILYSHLQEMIKDIEARDSKWWLFYWINKLLSNGPCNKLWLCGINSNSCSLCPCKWNLRWNCFLLCCWVNLNYSYLCYWFDSNYLVLLSPPSSPSSLSLCQASSWSLCKASPPSSPRVPLLLIRMPVKLQLVLLLNQQVLIQLKLGLLLSLRPPP